jgi:hypothetical protein
MEEGSASGGVVGFLLNEFAGCESFGGPFCGTAFEAGNHGRRDALFLELVSHLLGDDVDAFIVNRNENFLVSSHALHLTKCATDDFSIISFKFHKSSRKYLNPIQGVRKVSKSCETVFYCRKIVVQVPDKIFAFVFTLELVRNDISYVFLGVDQTYNKAKNEKDL